MLLTFRMLCSIVDADVMDAAASSLLCGLELIVRSTMERSRLFRGPIHLKYVSYGQLD